MSGEDPIEIRSDDLRGEAVVALLQEHVEEMRRISPPGSSHALDLEGLRAPGVAFWCAWQGEELLGCGALKELGDGIAEIKSMRTATAHRGKGVASRLLEHLMAEARRRGHTQLVLETGSYPAFAPARALYERFGFRYRPPFAGYCEDPHSVFMERSL